MVHGHCGKFILSEVAISLIVSEMEWDDTGLLNKRDLKGLTTDQNVWLDSGGNEKTVNYSDRF